MIPSTQRAPAYRRDRVTWASFGVLLAFGVLNAGLGPALPYLRHVEHVGYLGGVLHQVAFAIGGGLAGLLIARAPRMPPRTLVIRGGLLGAALAWLAVGYGNRLPVTAAGAFAVSFLGTAALIRVWAVLADEHGERRAVAMSEGEVAVSLGGVVSPLLVSVAAGSALDWHGAFLFASVVVAVAVSVTMPVRLPPALPGRAAGPDIVAGDRRRLPPTLVIVFAIVGLEFALSFWLASYLGEDVGMRRSDAAAMVSALYLANLVGRLVAGRLAHTVAASRLLGGALAVALLGLPVLLAATGAVVALVGLAIAGIGIGATFPLTSALHVAASPHSADGAIGQVLAVASIGQIAGPVVVAALAQQFGLRTGMVTLVALTLLAAAALRWQLGRL
ncbi:MAG TPA: MFS transporter [Jatrophihabitans sp.]|nr:MFS transporter [Jatrophihabitans sp.]